ncbi:MAG: molecular chaperone HtpG [Thermoanaerobaculia bacterium]|nr:molecular chaperone HtpG [Thermoanaerobaculia bacterium]
MAATTQSPEKTKKPETHEFQAETRQLLDIVIHSLYSNKEIFLRELISNASDALDRLRYEALENQELLEDDDTLGIRLETDPEARTLTISDNGVGMSHDEVIANIGTIAKSGTRELMAQIREAKNPEATAELIGQFGVGFYSAFMVANEVELVTRRAGTEEAWRWKSSGDGAYTLEKTEIPGRGTRITLKLKAVDEDNGLGDFTDTHVLRGIVKRHSDFVAYPILTKESRQEPKKDENGDEIKKEDGEVETLTVIEDVTLNSMQPIWTRPESGVEDSEYAEFYRHISHDWTEPLDKILLHAEGRIEYRALLFLPSKAPFDLFYRDSQHGLRLYVKRVMIKERFEELLPLYLRFVKGVVDSADLPLNVSREMVQQDRHITQMRKWLTKKVLDHLALVQKTDEEKYQTFWREFGKVLKEGVSMDFDNREKILPLLYFKSSHTESGEEEAPNLTSLNQYIERMKEDQEEIYYLTGDSVAQVESSPHLEAFRDKGYEVLYLIDPVDEIMVQSVSDFEDKALKSVGKGTVDLGSEEEKKQAEEELEESKKTYEELMKKLQTLLDEWVKEVRLSQRLTKSPACLVGSEFDMSPHLERLLRQTEGADVPVQKRILELNPKHTILEKLQARFDENEDDPILADYAHLLFGHSLLAEGSELPDPSRFNQLVAQLMTSGL